MKTKMKWSAGMLLFMVEVVSAQGYISVSVDDAPESVGSVMYPVLNQVGVVGTLYINPKYLSEPGNHDPSPWYISWPQVKLMAESGWEIGCHTYTHARLTELSNSAVEEELRLCNEAIMAHGFPKPKAFAAPFGATDDRVIGIVRAYYESQRNGIQADNGLNDVKKFNPYQLNVLALTENLSLGRAKELVDKAMSEGKWLILMGHKFQRGVTVPVDDPRKLENIFDWDTLTKIVEYAKQKKLKFVTISDGVKELLSQRKK